MVADRNLIPLREYHSCRGWPCGRGRQRPHQTFPETLRMFRRQVSNIIHARQPGHQNRNGLPIIPLAVHDVPHPANLKTDRTKLGH
jgi:hypothetical protein